MIPAWNCALEPAGVRIMQNQHDGLIAVTCRYPGKLQIEEYHLEYMDKPVVEDLKIVGEIELLFTKLGRAISALTGWRKTETQD
jgi:hypothetical protein